MTVRIETGFIGMTQPLDHPRIGWQAHSGTVSVSSADAGFPGAGALDPRTITAWRPDAFPATWTLTFNSPQVVSYLAIGAHDLGATGCNVELQIPDGADWATVQGLDFTPDDDGAIMCLMLMREIDAIRVRISGGSGLPTIGHIRAGEVLEMPRRAQFTGLPITEARQIEYDFNQSQTGEWQGMTIKRRGLEFDATIQHLSEAFSATEYRAFRNHADTGQPFFYAARPGQYADEVAYVFADGLVQSERALPNFRISRDVTMRLRGYARNG